jgi:rod shape-determining protein MreD
VRAVEPLKAGALLFLAAVVQASILSTVDALGGRPDLVLVTLVAVALLRGSVAGAVGGFFAGLVLDTATLETLGLTSLLLTVFGYWIGRYGETTGRDRAHAPYVSVGVVTVLYALGALVLHFVLGDHAPARLILLHRLPAAIVFNLLLTLPVYAAVRRLLRSAAAERVAEVRLLG